MAAEIQQRVGSVVQKPLVHTTTPLDGRCSVIRSSETNLGNMLADAYRAYYGADIALVNSGSIRCDRIIEPFSSPLRVKDIIG
jgi:UDP-sugar diphosphatase